MLHVGRGARSVNLKRKKNVKNINKTRRLTIPDRKYVHMYIIVILITSKPKVLREILQFKQM